MKSTGYVKMKSGAVLKIAIHTGHGCSQINVAIAKSFFYSDLQDLSAGESNAPKFWPHKQYNIQQVKLFEWKLLYHLHLVQLMACYSIATPVLICTGLWTKIDTSCACP